MRKRFTSISNFRQTVFLTGCLLFQTAFLLAQTPAENLSKGVEIYNALREYEDGLTPSTLTQEMISDVKNRANKGLALLESVIKEGNAEQIRAARYFKSNFKYEVGFVHGMKGENAKCYEYFKEIERDITALSAADFPIKYVYFDKNYTIVWDNFAPTQAEYYTGFAEVLYNLDKFEDAIRMNRLALNHPSTSRWLKYIALNKMLDLHAKNNNFLTEVEHLDLALQAMNAYNALEESELKSVVEFKYPTAMRGVRLILDKAVQNNPAALARCSAAALASVKEPLNEKTLQLFELCYRNKQTLDASFNESAEAYARSASTAYPAKATSVGISAVDRMALATSLTDCAGLQKIADKYTAWKQTSKAAEFTKKQAECRENEAKAQRKAARQARRYDRNFNLYAGMYILPLIKSNEHRDYGGALNFVFKKTAWEFSYLKIKKNKENVFDLTINDVDARQDDLSRWNGYYAHVQPKFLTKQRGYVGVLLGYAQKNFESLTSNATRNIDGVLTYETFSPKVTQYITMVNMGGLVLGKGFGMDAYMGIGATYSQWDNGSDLHTDDYTFENIILENRKDAYFSFIVRVGVTMGLNFGHGNLK